MCGMMTTMAIMERWSLVVEESNTISTVRIHHIRPLERLEGGTLWVVELQGKVMTTTTPITTRTLKVISKPQF
jgi:hypothetical protein